MSLARRIAPVFAVGLLLWLACGWATVAATTRPRRRDIPPRTELSGLPVIDVTTTTADGVEVDAWFVEASGERVAILFAGRGGDRLANLGAAEHYLARGWSVLLPDLRGTGTSGGDRVGFGWLERRDVQAWVDWARARGLAEVGLHGQSLGAAAVLYAQSERDDRPAFVVLEACYDDVRTALWNRLPWMPWPSLTLKPVEWFGALAVDASVDELRPAACIGSVACPTLLVAGDADPVVLPEETRALFEACGSERKSLCWMPGGRHEGLWRRFSASYAAALDELLGS